MNIFSALLLAFAFLSAAPAPASAQAPARAAAPADNFEADRRAILGMAGTFHVRFDMRETTSWRPDYTPIPAATSGGNEVVRVIADTGRFISLQHLLVVDDDGTPTVVKHWRQDWTYEPRQVLAYAGPNTWRTTPVAAAQRRGAWSQTVWQVDDSPRYGGVGRWATVGGTRRWTSDDTWRPLARRDAIRHPRYDRYLGVNRHGPTPDGGWVHWQDNLKMGNVDGAVAPFVQESVLNTYRPATDFNIAAADRYWAATRDYWAAVRAEWDRVEHAGGGIRVREQAQAGTVISERLMDMASEIVDGRRQTPAAVAEAQRLIREETARR